MPPIKKQISPLSHKDIEMDMVLYSVNGTDSGKLSLKKVLVKIVDFTGVRQTAGGEFHFFSDCFYELDDAINEVKKRLNQ